MAEEDPERWQEPVVRIGADKMWARLEAQEARIQLLEVRYWGVVVGLGLALAHLWGGAP